ncbi:hypothetical protein CRYUN_Cryun36dG0104900 [Craigia yunnanensis]
MGKYLAFCLVMLQLSIAFANVPNTLNETCLDDISIVLQINLYKKSCRRQNPSSSIGLKMQYPKKLLRLHFHDCFVNTRHSLGLYFSLRFSCKIMLDVSFAGCDASVLLDGTEDFIVRGPSGKSKWAEKTAWVLAKAAATNNIPGPNSTVPTLVAKFQNVGLSFNDMAALSGAHTMGMARCSTFTSRLQGGPDINLDFLQNLQQLCSESNGNTRLAHLDLVSPATFDNQYYINLLSGEGLLPSDQALVTEDYQTRQLVLSYAEDPLAFFEDFKNSMLKMGSLGPLTGSDGEIRRNYRIVNELHRQMVVRIEANLTLES